MNRNFEIDPARKFETTRLVKGTKVICNGYEGTVSKLYSDGETEAGRMYEVRMERGSVCVCGSDLIPVA